MSAQLRVIGGRPLEGEVCLKGAKNSVPKQMVAALLSSQPSILRNIAHVEDIAIMTKLIERIGGSVTEIEPGTLRIHAPKLQFVPGSKMTDVAGKSRIPILMVGPMLHRVGRAVIPALGGCEIGSRPINFHIDALFKLGATHQAKKDGDYFETNGQQLRGAIIELEYPSVGSTEQVLLSGVLAEGVTELRNAAIEPEIIDTVSLLQKMGAIIAVSDNRTITITGVKELHGYDHTAMPDRLEAASWACAAAATNGRIFVRGAQQLPLLTFLNQFRQVGGEFDVEEAGITFYRGRELSSTYIETDVHPGFMTDWQQPFVILMTQAQGASVIHETVYESRFGYVEALNSMGAQIQLYHECLGPTHCRFAQRNYLHSAVVTGPTQLHGATIRIPDLRAGFSYVIAALVAKGESTIDNYAILNRGYESLTDKLKSLGAEVVEG